MPLGLPRFVGDFQSEKYVMAEGMSREKRKGLSLCLSESAEHVALRAFDEHAQAGISAI